MAKDETFEWLKETQGLVEGVVSDRRETGKKGFVPNGNKTLIMHPETWESEELAKKAMEEPTRVQVHREKQLWDKMAGN